MSTHAIVRHQKEITSVDSVTNCIRTKQTCLSFGKLSNSKAATDFPKFRCFTWNFKFYHSQHILPGLFSNDRHTLFIFKKIAVRDKSLKNHRCLSAALLSENSMPFKSGSFSPQLISRAMPLRHSHESGRHWWFLYTPTAPHRTLSAKVET